MGRKGYDVFLELFLVLEDLLKSKRLVCPASYFHFVETDVDLKLAEEIRWVVGYLSEGFSFLHWKEVLRRQFVNGFYRFIGMKEKYEGYYEALVHTNHRWDEIYPSGEQKELKETKRSYVVEMERLKSTSTNSTLYDLVSRNKDTIVNKYAGELLKGLEDSRVASYLNSFAIRNAPFVDIFASLDACFVLYDGNRRPRGSDQIDLLMTATVLPYVDIFATDRYIKNNIVIKLHFDRKYNVEVYSGKVDDVKGLIRRLCSMFE